MLLAGTDKLSPVASVDSMADLALITPGSHLTCAGVHILSVPPQTFHADRLPDADWVQGFDMLVLIVLLALLDSKTQVSSSVEYCGCIYIYIYIFIYSIPELQR